MEPVRRIGSRGAPAPRSGSLGRGWIDAAVFAAYILVSFLYFGLRLLIQPGRQYIGPLDDPQIPIWSFAWWPHAITHGMNPVITHVLWAPDGINLTWANAVPSLAILFWPLTALVGPVTAYNVSVILIPAASAWTGYLLCRRLTGGALWPSLAGGYLFGFSTYLLGQQAGHLQLISTFFIPLVALLCLRFLDGELGRVALALWLAAILVLQLLFSSELEFTMTLALGIALVLGYVLAPERRKRILSLLPPLVLAYVIAGIVTAPWLYYTVTGLRIAAFQPPEQYLADLANLVVPTHLSALGAGWAHSITDRFPGNDAERIAYLGVPALVAAGLYAWRYRRTSGARFLVACGVVAMFLSLGPELTVAGHAVLPLPTVFGHDYWTIPGFGTIHLSLFNNVLPDRLMLYTSLVVAVMVALWAARTPHRTAAWVVPALAVVSLLPNPWADAWATTYSVPPFFTDDAYRACLAPDENILPLPIGQGGDSMLWQTEAGFRFRMAGGRITTSPPSSFLHPDELAQISVGYDPSEDQVALFRNYFKVKRVTSVLLDKRHASVWSPSLDRIAKPEDVGGILLYRVAGQSTPAGCPRT